MFYYLFFRYLSLKYTTMLKRLSQLSQQLPTVPKKLVLAAAHDQHALEAVFEAKSKGIIEPILVGKQKEIELLAKHAKLELAGVEIINVERSRACIHKAVQMISQGKGDILMKGRVQTPDLLAGVLNKDYGLKTGKRLSHLAVFEIDKYHKLVGITDVAMNSAPDLMAKKEIIENAVIFMQKVGITIPKVAVLAAIERVNPKMTATTDAEKLTQMNMEGAIKNCQVFGPVAFDGAMNRAIAEDKNILHPVAGDADILLVPNIEAGNILYKSLILFSEVNVAALILGAKVPIVLTSRSDSEETKFNSILLAASI